MKEIEQESVEKCGHCGENPAQEFHTCPYAEEINVIFVVNAHKSVFGLFRKVLLCFG